MATIGWRYLSGPVEVQTFPEDATSGSFVAGDLVGLSSGELILATQYKDTNVGVALADHTDTAGTKIPVMIINPLQRWIVAADTTTAATMVGAQYGFNVTTDNNAVDLSQTTADGGVVIEALDPRDGAHTGSGGRLIVRFTAAACQMNGTVV
jgi:hypothetical protein